MSIWKQRGGWWVRGTASLWFSICTSWVKDKRMNPSSPKWKNAEPERLPVLLFREMVSNMSRSLSSRLNKFDLGPKCDISVWSCWFLSFHVCFLLLPSYKVKTNMMHFWWFLSGKYKEKKLFPDLSLWIHSFWLTFSRGRDTFKEGLLKSKNHTLLWLLEANEKLIFFSSHAEMFLFKLNLQWDQPCNALCGASFVWRAY